jgi:hypothetical protein
MSLRMVLAGHSIAPLPLMDARHTSICGAWDRTVSPVAQRAIQLTRRQSGHKSKWRLIAISDLLPSSSINSVWGRESGEIAKRSTPGNVYFEQVPKPTSACQRHS